MTQPTLSPVPAETVPAGKAVPADAPQISVVVPVYKVEKFVAECLESILSQDFDSFEVVAVDDGSPDASGKICDEFAARDSRLRVFHKENGGVTSARRLGVERSRGEWICFVDSDDVLLPHALSALFAATQQFPDADIVEGGHVVFRENSDLDESTRETVPATNSPKEPPVVSGVEYARRVALCDGFFGPAPWRKIIRHRAVSESNALNISAKIIWGEDRLVNFAIATRARQVLRIPNVVYAYRMNPESIGHTGGEIYFSADYCALFWETARKRFEEYGGEWCDIFSFFLADLLPFSYLNATGKFLNNPKIRPFVSFLNIHEVAKYSSSKSFRCRLILFRCRLVFLGTKFPFSLVPEPIFRLAIRVLICVILRTLNFPRKISRKLRGRR